MLTFLHPADLESPTQNKILCSNTEECNVILTEAQEDIMYYKYKVVLYIIEELRERQSLTEGNLYNIF